MLLDYIWVGINQTRLPTTYNSLPLNQLSNRFKLEMLPPSVQANSLTISNSMLSLSRETEPKPT